ncbi:TetR/AcrR family transcriptional regulator [Mycobacterium sp. WUMAC-067]|uniref:TetR/AcrR family transcriptional regulator n=1 Tax=unclassified Mycobacterium TaxID=2642494 RepID=UPI001CD94486|nr:MULTISPECIES: TetR/AcrR family transcriptional regulator [unclassified Mycobacterium]MCA2241987.1 TetR/AcrR family transcriptional regulator [Mycobacterium sp. WUMAC-067]MCA2314495.1 TetR/AcrR family transcriptional regulator [Mycobacterium sp. WUMAC-025]
MAASARRVGAETSKTRDTLLDHVEKMMLDEGYASVTYRALASAAGVTPSLVQYYFPTLDDIFLSAIRRYSERSRRLLDKVLESRPDDPLRALWEFSRTEASGALMTEFMALGNHRKSIQAEIAAVTQATRKRQVDALVAKFGKSARPGGHFSLPALQLLISGLPKFLNLEEGIGVKTAHKEVTNAFEKYLDSIEPAPAPKRKTAQRRSR